MTSEIESSTLLRTRTKVFLLVFVVGVYFFSFFQRVAVPGTIFNELQSDLAQRWGSASAAQITLLGALFLYPYAATQVFVGVLVDKLGAARVLLLGGVVMAIGSMLFPLSSSWVALYGTRVMVGLGASLIFLSVVKELDMLFAARHFPLVFGISLFFGYSGGLVATWPLERAVQAFDWRQPMLVAGVVCSVVVVGAAILLKRARQLGHSQTTYSLKTLLQIITNRSTWPILVSGSMNFAIYFLLQGAIGKKLLQDCHGFSSEAAASVTFAMLLLMMCVTFASGFLVRLMAERRKPLLLVATTLTLVATGVTTVSLTPQWGRYVTVVCFLAIAIAGGISVVFCCVMKEVNPPAAAGSSVGLLNGVAYLMVAIVVSGAGLMMDRFADQAIQTAESVVYPATAYRAVFICCLGLALISSMISPAIRETRGSC